MINRRLACSGGLGGSIRISFLIFAFLPGMPKAWPEEPVVRVGFESAGGFPAGSIELGEGWSVGEGTAILIDVEEKANGGQSLKIEASTPSGAVNYVSKAVPADGIRFIDLQIKPAALEAGADTTALDAWGSSLDFVKKEDGVFLIALVDGGETSGRSLTTTLQSEANGRVDRWTRLTMRQDMNAKTWDLSVDGQLIAVNLALADEGTGELTVFGSETAPTNLDELGVGTENPLFPDADHDGMPDVEEIVNGLNVQGDDRLGDLDCDGVSNIGEMLAGTSPRVPGSGGTQALASLIYVDNLNGSDGNNGRRSYAVGGDGPKASIKAAMAAASGGEMIVVMPGKGIYDEGSRGAPGKRLTIKALSNVTIK